MSITIKELAANQQADGDGNGDDMVSGYVPVGASVQNGHVNLVGDASADFTATIYAPDTFGNEVPIHQEVFSGAKVRAVKLGDRFPYSRLKTKLSSYTAGAFWASLNHS